MLKQDQRTAILELHRRNLGTRRIARMLGLSRTAVKRVIASASPTPPPLLRPEKAEPYRRDILELYSACRGNLVRVHEELLAAGVKLSYPALTAYCRRQGIGQKAKRPAGQYHFHPGQELQHDTSPYQIELGGRVRSVQIASAVLCYSRLLFCQCYPTFQRFDCKVFLTEALRYFGGACQTVMIDNTSVVVLRGTGAGMVPVPEMAAFAERYGFDFIAHEVGDANRSGRVERPFTFIQDNFLVKRTFLDWNDLNRQARAWCDRVNASYKKHLRAIPRDLFVTERPCLKPLPVWVPEVYRLHHRIVDVEGYVALNTNRYSAPVDWIGRSVEVREYQDRLEIQCGLRQCVRHERVIDALGKRITLPEHRPARGSGRKRTDPRPEEKVLEQLVPELAGYLAALKQHGRRNLTLALRQLLRMAREYPREPFLAAVAEASHYGLYDMERLERMILRRIASDYFHLDPEN